mmetsp:Transcript_102063/g.243385  ORF Transcript_102063/g.243385 Transcript_102063/m.243385 type:complete len:507 (+) Transcript_102063:1033-2553(+)
MTVDAVRSAATALLARTVTGLAHVGAAGVVHARRALAGAVHKVALVRHVARSARLCIPHAGLAGPRARKAMAFRPFILPIRANAGGALQELAMVLPAGCAILSGSTTGGAASVAGLAHLGAPEGSCRTNAGVVIQNHVQRLEARCAVARLAFAGSTRSGAGMAYSVFVELPMRALFQAGVVIQNLGLVAGGALRPRVYASSAPSSASPALQVIGKLPRRAGVNTGAIVQKRAAVASEALTGGSLASSARGQAVLASAGHVCELPRRALDLASGAVELLALEAAGAVTGCAATGGAGSVARTANPQEVLVLPMRALRHTVGPIENLRHGAGGAVAGRSCARLAGVLALLAHALRGELAPGALLHTAASVNQHAPIAACAMRSVALAGRAGAVAHFTDLVRAGELAQGTGLLACPVIQDQVSRASRTRGGRVSTGQTGWITGPAGGGSVRKAAVRALDAAHIQVEHLPRRAAGALGRLPLAVAATGITALANARCIIILAAGALPSAH